MDFGPISLSSAFPYKNLKYNEIIPMIFGICKNCRSAQLLHNYDLKTLYNDEYGYRSGINQSMINHLAGITKDIKKIIKFKKGDYVLDIASNDATLLKSYKSSKINYVGIDPTINKYKEYYPKNYKTKSALFSKKKYFDLSAKQKAKIITSIAMFYDVQNPNKFVSDIRDILRKDGIWVMEMYFLPILLKYNAYDSICHEHITYFSSKQINYLCKKNNLKIFKISLNSMNCGSVRYFICHNSARFKINYNSINQCRKLEKILDNDKCFYDFKKRVKLLSKKLNLIIKNLNKKKKIIHIYGASTKGNISIQYLKLTVKDIGFAADRNPLKWNRKMPGSNIPIISEESSRAKNPDFYLVLPWHFKKGFVEREEKFLKRGGKLIFPLPKIEILSKNKLK
jgi:hypothetical protein|tara:strand:+ start:1161 stop:2348 length:1188 start_codon:yes stop_codon:yes gene_type:complete